MSLAGDKKAAFYSWRVLYCLASFNLFFHTVLLGHVAATLTDSLGWIQPIGHSGIIFKPCRA